MCQLANIMMMESNDYPLTGELQSRIQGLIGELVGLRYVLDNLKTDENDSIIIVTNRSANIRRIVNHLYPNKTHPKVFFRTFNESPLEFLSRGLVDEFHKIGCEGIDFTNADIEAKNLFDKYKSKNKKQILSELERLERLYRKEEEKMREEGEKDREEFERRIKERESIGNDNESYKTWISEIVNTLSQEDLAKVLTLIELENRYFKKERLSISAFKISSLNTFYYHFLRSLEWKEYDYKNRRDEIKMISEHANAKFEKWKIFSSVFNCLYPFHLNHPITKIDSMIVHSHGEELYKIILIECKTNKAGLSPGQKEFIDRLKNIKSDKVEYRKINIDYQAPKQLTVSEIWHIP